MKRNRRILCGLLCLMMLCQMAACARQRKTPAPEQTETTAVQTEAPTEPTTIPTTAPTTPPTTQPPTEPPTESPTTAPTEPEETEPAKVEITQIPNYYQTDYPDDLFAAGTIATQGSSITCLAMVATYLTDHVYQPNELAKWFGPYPGSPYKRLDYASDQLQLSWMRAENWHKARQALKEGKILIAALNSKSQFTDKEHCVVITGYTQDGKYLVNDPNEENYSHWALREGFEKGFEDWQISCGYTGGWIYDKAAMAEEPFIFEPPDYSDIEPRYPGMELTKEEKKLLASVIWIEAQGEPFEGQQAIAEVMLNRLAADNFPNKLREIIYADGQFPSTAKLDRAKPCQTQYEAIERAQFGPYVLPIDVVFFATWAQNKNVWGKIGGHTFCYQWDKDMPATEPTEK